MSAALVAAVVASSAGAATLNFADEGDGLNGGGGERAETDGYILDNANTDFLKVKINSFGDYVYFDSSSSGKQAGLGICQNLSGTQCNPPSDDNVTVSEKVKLSFLDDSEKPLLQKLSGLVFRDAEHNILSSLETLLFGYNGGALFRYTFADLINKTFDGVYSVTFAYDNTGANRNEFYISSATSEAPTGGPLAPVPLPAGLPLMLAGLGLFGLGARLKSKRSA